MGDTPSGNQTPSPSLEEMSGKVMVAAIVILVMLILIVVVVHLYARWFWSRHGAEIHRLRRSRSRLAFSPSQDPSHRGLEASVVQALPLLVFKQDDFKDGLECAVCLCELEDGDKARLLPKCNHGFHVECIDMWFQSHSTCPLCRITVGAESSELSSPGTETEEANSASDSLHLEIPNFPTNVLFWGNGSTVSARNNGQEERPAALSPPQSPCSSMYATPNISREGSLIIDIPTRLMDGFSSQSASASKPGLEEAKSPMSARFRSLTRLLSREKRVNPPSPSSVDVEQGEGGRGQSSKTSIDS